MKKGLKGELVRVNTEDDLELQGFLVEPRKRTRTAVVYVHGWVGNFYENLFLNSIAKRLTGQGLAFLSCNNRGAGIVTEFVKSDKSNTKRIRIGGSLERFEDCIKDIRAYIDYLSSRGYDRIILKGHSLSCQKTTYYKYMTGDARVKGLIFLAPVDDVAVSKRLLGRRYLESLKIAKKMVEEGNGDMPVPGWMQFYPLLSASTFLSVANPDSASARIFDCSGELKEIKEIDCPVLAIFGSRDNYQHNPETQLKLLNETAKDCTVFLIDGANHWFAGSEENLSEHIGNWIKEHITK